MRGHACQGRPLCKSGRSCAGRGQRTCLWQVDGLLPGWHDGAWLPALRFHANACHEALSNRRIQHGRAHEHPVHVHGSLPQYGVLAYKPGATALGVWRSRVNGPTGG
jgi:hypothetical protein